MKKMYCIKAVCIAALFIFAACGSASELRYDGSGSTTGRLPSDDGNDDGNGGNDGDDGGNRLPTSQHQSAVSVAYLRSLAVGTSTAIDRPYSVTGRVTANDAYGEYYRTVCIEDPTGGIEAEIEGYTLYRTFALYDMVRIECHGLALGRYGSRILLGAPPTGSSAVDPVAQADIGRYFTIYKSDDDSFEPLYVASAAALQPSHVGRTVRIGMLCSADGGSCWCIADPQTGDFIDTERTLTDSDGNTLTVCIRSGCRYAGEPIPDGPFSLCGIIEYRSGSGYALRITNHGIILGEN